MSPYTSLRYSITLLITVLMMMMYRLLPSGIIYLGLSIKKLPENGRKENSVGEDELFAVYK